MMKKMLTEEWWLRFLEPEFMYVCDQEKYAHQITGPYHRFGALFLGSFYYTYKGFREGHIFSGFLGFFFTQAFVSSHNLGVHLVLYAHILIGITSFCFNKHLHKRFHRNKKEETFSCIGRVYISSANRYAGKDTFKPHIEQQEKENPLTWKIVLNQYVPGNLF